jgi:transcriptional regulator with XRE-family HTH domain
VPEISALFARQVRTFREKAGLTQGRVAAAMTARGWKMHQTTIAKIESGDRPAELGEAIALAGVLGVAVTKLITEDRGEGREVAEAQVAVAVCARERDERLRLAAEAQVRLDDAEARLAAAQQGRKSGSGSVWWL